MTGSSLHHVRVVARIRPLSQTEQEQGSKEAVTSLQDPGNKGESELIETTSGITKKRWFELDAVFDKECSQEEVYVRSGAKTAVCEHIFNGYNATILAYGQTGAGKTHTMGSAAATFTEEEEKEEDGMIPRACIDLFENVEKKCDGNCRVELSYLEIYNEEIRDLLAATTTTTPNQNLKIRETLEGEVYVSGLTERQVCNTRQVGKFMEEASKRRVVASTAMNAVSSRSHAICTLKISGVVENGNNSADKFTSKLTLVDQAGTYVL